MGVRVTDWIGIAIEPVLLLHGALVGLAFAIPRESDWICVRKKICNL
jgi:hypothetical protein